MGLIDRLSWTADAEGDDAEEKLSQRIPFLPPTLMVTRIRDTRLGSNKTESNEY